MNIGLKCDWKCERGAKNNQNHQKRQRIHATVVRYRANSFYFHVIHRILYASTITCHLSVGWKRCLFNIYIYIPSDMSIFLPWSTAKASDAPHIHTAE